MFCIRKVPIDTHHVKQQRDRVEFLCLVQSLLAGAGILYLAIGGMNALLLVCSGLELVLGLLGQAGSRSLSQFSIGVHSVLTCSFSCGVFLLEVLALSIARTTGEFQQLLFVLMFFYDMACGCFGLSLLLRVMSPTIQSEVTQSLIEQCAVCKSSPQVYSVYPCGHKCLCIECSSGYIRDWSRCPICQETIQDFYSA